MPRTKHVAIVKSPPSHMGGTNVVYYRGRAKKYAIAELSYPKEDVRIFSDPPYSPEVVPKSSKLCEDLPTKGHVRADTMLDLNRRTWIRREVSGQVARGQEPPNCVDAFTLLARRPVAGAPRDCSHRRVRERISDPGSPASPSICVIVEKRDDVPRHVKKADIS